MTDYVDIMIDLETLGLDVNSAPMLGIGACRFDDTSISFKSCISIKSACEGRSINPETVKWWFAQSQEAAKVLFSGVDDMRSSLLSLSSWIREQGDMDSVRVWGNGVCFDISMLESYYNQYNIKIPWSYRNKLDVRTVCAIGLMIGVDHREEKFEGVYHDPLDDAVYQVNYVNKILSKVGEMYGRD